MDISELKEQIRNNVKFESVSLPPITGQSCGVMFPKQRLISEELDLVLTTGYHRSMFKNRELLLSLFNAALDDLVK